jgi:catechol 2,3-dioxygenase-like lactoylglutathione lyase family enzyme
MIDHVGIRTKQLAALTDFYEKALAPLGYAKLSAYDGGAGFGADGEVQLWLTASSEPSSSVHLAVSAATQKAVDQFHKAALAAGAKDNGKPGLRPDYSATYYAAFVIDPDGNNIEAVFHQG